MVFEEVMSEVMSKARQAAMNAENKWFLTLLTMGFIPSESLLLGGLGKSVGDGNFIIEVTGLWGGSVRFTAGVMTPSGPQGVVTWESDSPDSDHFLSCLRNPDQLPTCVGIDWAGDLLEVWMRYQ